MIHILYIYKFYNNNSLLYIGKSKNIYSRFNAHKNSKEWFSEVTHIHIAMCKNDIDMDIYELYYINKLNPLYNIASVKNTSPTFEIDELEFKILPINEFLKVFAPAPNSRNFLSKRQFEFTNALKDSIDITNTDITINDINSNKFHWYINDTTIRFIEIDNYIFLKSAIKYIIDSNIDLDNDFEMPLSYDDLLSSDNFFTGVRYTHYDTTTYRNVICTGGQSFIRCVILSKDNIPTSCRFVNMHLKYLLKKELLLKYIIDWKN